VRKNENYFGWLRRRRKRRNNYSGSRYAEKVKDYGFNPKIVAIADIDGAVINPRGLSPEKLEEIKQRGYPISADKDFGVQE
jgi:hypothetical protein